MILKFYFKSEVRIKHKKKALEILVHMILLKLKKNFLYQILAKKNPSV